MMDVEKERRMVKLLGRLLDAADEDIRVTKYTDRMTYDDYVEGVCMLNRKNWLANQTGG